MFEADVVVQYRDDRDLFGPFNIAEKNQNRWPHALLRILYKL